MLNKNNSEVFLLIQLEIRILELFSSLFSSLLINSVGVEEKMAVVLVNPWKYWFAQSLVIWELLRVKDSQLLPHTKALAQYLLNWMN